MKSTDKKKQAEMKEKFEKLKQQHDSSSGDQQKEEETTENNGVIPERSFKKNLGCG